MAAREHGRSDPKTLALIDRAERLLAGAAVPRRLVESFGIARRAYGLWKDTSTDEEAKRWVHVLASRSLAAALEAQVVAGPSTDLAKALLELARVAFTAKEREWEGPRWEPPPLVKLGGSGPPAVPIATPPREVERPQPIVVEPLPPPEPAAPPSAPPSTEKTQRATPVDLYPIERCASIAASIARRKSDKEEILETQDLSEAEWADLDRHWSDAVKADIKRGRSELLATYDEAYVAQLEAERGPITVEQYAKLVVAAERGVEHEALEELGLPRGASARLKRVWLKKTMRDKALARRFRELLDS